MTPIIPERLSSLPGITLSERSHACFDEGHCAMEVVSWLTGERFTDTPRSVSQALRIYTIVANDTWDDQNRQSLLPLLPLMVDTAYDDQEISRYYLSMNWMTRIYTPGLLSMAGLSSEADALRSLRPVIDAETQQAARDVLTWMLQTTKEAVTLSQHGPVAVEALGLAQESLHTGINTIVVACDAIKTIEELAGRYSNDKMASDAIQSLRSSALHLLSSMITPELHIRETAMAGTTA